MARLTDAAFAYQVGSKALGVVPESLAMGAATATALALSRRDQTRRAMVERHLRRVRGPQLTGRALDRAVRADEYDGDRESERVWRGWVDEVVASWAACLLSDARLTADAVTAVAGFEHAAESAHDFARLAEPDAEDRRAAALLRHPDLVAPVANLHRALLIERLRLDPVEVA